MTAYYNEIDPKAAAWLRELIKAGIIAPGEVDERSIEDVTPNELMGFTQCHFFAGIGVWSYALRQAGYPDDRQVWTGSCPCQPFSAAGKGTGFADERHLWPAWHWLIEQCRPSVVLGEQVASKDGLGWLDLVQTDMEGTRYAFAAVDTCAAGFGAPHIRQRLYFVGENRLYDTETAFGRSTRSTNNEGRRPTQTRRPSVNGGLADTSCFGKRTDELGRDSSDGEFLAGSESGSNSINNGSDDILAHTHHQRSQGRSIGRDSTSECASGTSGMGGEGLPGPTNGFWEAADWLLCRDGKWRPVEPGTFPLAHGATSRVGRLRGYGNAINAAQAQGFIEAYIEIRGAA